MKILPGTGRGTATRSGLVEGALHLTQRMPRTPSTSLRRVPLPVLGRIK
jgi:hypothetical protein